MTIFGKVTKMAIFGDFRNFLFDSFTAPVICGRMYA